ncbi:MAG: glycosyltransferase family 39 protein [Armatimonadetes bacterium]|nr:glycosyltransferase family 39 protein [Armatimonadota bacterium]
MSHERRWLAAILLGAFLLFTFRLGDGSLWDQDEAKYTQVAREMVLNGDPLTLRYNGVPWFVHPPLYFWLVAATARLFGFTEFVARIWSAVFGVAGVWATYLLGRDLYGPRTGLLAAVILATALQYFIQSRLAVFDVVLVAFMLLAARAFWIAYRTDGRRALPFFAWAGLATLAKGPIGLLLPGMVALVFLALRRDLKRLREVPWHLGIPLYAVIGLGWYVVEALRHGGAFVGTAIGYYTFTRFLGAVEGQSGSVWYYVPVLLLGTFPWTAFAPGMIAYHWRQIGAGRSRRLAVSAGPEAASCAPASDADASLFLLLWCALTFLFYTAAGTKLPNYVLPIYPLLAVGLGAMWDAALGEGDPAARRAAGWGVALMAAAAVMAGAGIVFFLRGRYPAEMPAIAGQLRLIGLIQAVGTAAAAGAFLARRDRLAFAAIPVAMVVTLAVVLVSVLPVVEAHKPMKTFAATVRARLGPDEHLAVLMEERASLRYYVERRVEWFDDAGRFLAHVCASPHRVVVVPEGPEHAALRASLGPARAVARGGGVQALEMEGRLACR